jgi:hypothetical protein
MGFIHCATYSYFNYMGGNIRCQGGQLMIRKLIILSTLLLAPLAVYSQVPVSASNVADAFERPIASAKLCFAPVDATGAAAGFRAGTVQVVSTSVCGLVSNGVLQSGLVVAPTPAGIYYHITAQNRTTNAVMRDYGMTQVTGSSWTLDSYDPNMAVLPVSVITVGTVATLAPGLGAYCTISGSSPYLLNCGIPQGVQGLKGDTGVVTCAAGTCGTNGDYNVAGKMSASNVVAGTSIIGKVIQLPGGVQSAGTLASFLLTFGANTTYTLPPDYSETVTSTIALSQNSVNIQCGNGATLINGASVNPGAIIVISGANDTIGSGCKFDNNNVQISNYGQGAIDLEGSTNTVLNGITVINCSSASAAPTCVSAININGGQFNHMTLGGTGRYGMSITAAGGSGNAGNGVSQNFEVIGGNMGYLEIHILPISGTGDPGIVKNFRVADVNLRAVGGGSACGGIGIYSGSAGGGSILNGSVTGTTCTISGTASVAVSNVVISGSGSTGTITLTLASASPFHQWENLALSQFATNTCLNGKFLYATATSGSTVSFSTSGTTCTTASGADTGRVVSAAYGGWSNVAGDGFIFSNNTVQFAAGTSQYISYAGYEMSCTNCTVSNNIFEMPDAYGQSYDCIISYSNEAVIADNLCNGFGAKAIGINLAGGVVKTRPSSHVQILNNTVINDNANNVTASTGIGYGCNYTGLSAQYGQISGNHIYGPFKSGFSIGDSTSDHTCPVEFTAHDNQIYGATIGYNIFYTTGSISNTLFSGVTTPISASHFTTETISSNTPQSLPSGSTAVTQAITDTGNDLATDAFVAGWISGQTNVLPFPYGIANRPQTAPPSTGLVAWYPASSTCSTTGTTPTTLTDASGNGYTLTGTGATCETNIVNGKPVLRFAGTGTGYQGAFSVTTSGTTIISIYRKTVGSAAWLVDGYGAVANNTMWFTPATSINARLSGVTLTATAADDNNVHVAAYVISSTGTGTLYLDGVQATTGTQAVPYLSGLTIGAKEDRSAPWNGDIVDTIVYGSAYTATQLQSFGQYASAQYGLVLSRSRKIGQWDK